MRKIIYGFLMLAVPTVAFAANELSLTTTSFLQKQVVDAQGRRKTVLEDAKLVVPGSRILYVFSFRNNGPKPATGVVFTDPVPAGMTFDGTDDASAVVSVDAGASWGPLALAKVRTAAGVLRAAQPGDVTHVRWAFRTAIAPGSSGKLSMRVIVK
jgi:uncharacterized repeat protein (TIGR01451 family)